MAVPVRQVEGRIDHTGNVTVVGMKDGASTMPVDASRLYAKNVVNLLLLMTSEGQVVPDFGDEVVAGTCLTHDGSVQHAQTAELLGLAPAAAPPAAGSGSEPPPAPPTTQLPTQQPSQQPTQTPTEGAGS